MIAACICTYYMQAEARFREELGSVNITAESRMFRTEDNPIETADLFVSTKANNDFLRV